MLAYLLMIFHYKNIMKMIIIIYSIILDNYHVRHLMLNRNIYFTVVNNARVFDILLFLFCNLFIVLPARKLYLIFNYKFLK